MKIEIDQNPEQQKKTDLEVFLRLKLPELAKKYGDRVLLVITLIILATAVLMYRSRAAEAERVFIEDSAATAWQLLQASGPMLASPTVTDEAARQRLERVANIESRVAEVLSRETSPQHRAIALLTRAELSWKLSHLPRQSLTTTQPVAGATTRPSSEYASQAEADYRQILAQFPDQRDPAMAALFGLAAIEEDRGNFDAAAQRYKQVIDDKLSRPHHKRLAEQRLKLLDDLREPLLVVEATTQPASPTSPAVITQPSIEAPAPLPTPLLPSMPPAPTPVPPVTPSEPATAPVEPAPTQPAPTSVEPAPTTAPTTNPS